MDFDLLSCTFENLSSLKFNQLQKLSSQFRITKRWATKKEIIEKLLLLRDQEIEKKTITPKDPENHIQIHDNMNWIDGSEAFSDNFDKTSSFNDRRLTYDINASISNVENFERPLIHNNSNLKFDGQKQISRETFVIKKAEKSVESLVFEKKRGKENNMKSINGMENASAEISGFFENGEQFNTIKDESVNHKAIIYVTNENHTKNSLKHTKNIKRPLKGNSLTIPTTTLHESRKAIKKDLLKTKLPEMSHMKKSSRKSVEAKMSNSSSKNKPCHNVKKDRFSTSNGSTVATSHLLEKSAAKDNFPNSSTLQSNIQMKGRVLLKQKKFKTEDNVSVKNLKHKEGIKFFSPIISDIKRIGRLPNLSSPNLDFSGTFKSKIPKAKPVFSIAKPTVMTKMPDFSKIHQKQFEQMDSLIDYVRKKEERKKTLFGTPANTTPIKVSNNVDVVFHFKSSNEEKENQTESRLITPMKMLSSFKEQNLKSTRKEALGGVKSSVMNLKEQNKKHISAVRTNRRFELQMKCRKM